MSGRRFGGKSTYGGFTVSDKKRLKSGRSRSQEGVRASSIQPSRRKARSPAPDYSLRTVVPSQEDREWAHARAQSPGAKGFKERWAEKEAEMRARTDTTSYLPPRRSPSRSPIQRSKSMSASRSRSYSGSPGDDDPPPDVAVQLSPSLEPSVHRPQLAPQVLQAQVVGSATAARRWGGIATGAPYDVASVDRSVEPERSATREPSLEQETRSPIPAYFDRMVKPEGPHVKQERGPAWSQSGMSMPRAMHDTSPSRSQSLSQKAHMNASTTKFKDVLSRLRSPGFHQRHMSSRSEYPEPGGGAAQFRQTFPPRSKGRQASLSRDPQDLPVRQRESIRSLSRYGADAHGIMHMPDDTGFYEYDRTQRRHLDVIHEPEHTQGEVERSRIRETRAKEDRLARERSSLARVQSQEHDMSEGWLARTMGKVEYEKDRKRRQLERSGAKHAKQPKRLKIDVSSGLSTKRRVPDVAGSPRQHVRTPSPVARPSPERVVSPPPVAERPAEPAPEQAPEPVALVQRKQPEPVIQEERAVTPEPPPARKRVEKRALSVIPIPDPEAKRMRAASVATETRDFQRSEAIRNMADQERRVAQNMLEQQRRVAQLQGYQHGHEYGRRAQLAMHQQAQAQRNAHNGYGFPAMPWMKQQEAQQTRGGGAPQASPGMPWMRDPMGGAPQAQKREASPGMPWLKQQELAPPDFASYAVGRPCNAKSNAPATTSMDTSCRSAPDKPKTGYPGSARTNTDGPGRGCRTPSGTNAYPGNSARADAPAPANYIRVPAPAPGSNYILVPTRKDLRGGAPAKRTHPDPAHLKCGA